MERFEQSLEDRSAIEPRQADAYFASAIHLAGRIPLSAQAEFGMLDILTRAGDLALLLERAQAVGELAQMRAYLLEREARWDEARSVRLAALATDMDLGISTPMLLIGQAQAEMLLGSLGQALFFAGQAEERLFLELNPTAPGFARAQTQILGVKGELLVVLGLLDQAQEPIRASLQLAEELGDPALLVAALTRQAALLGAALQADSLRRLIQSSLADARIAGDERLRAALWLRLGICLASLGDPLDTGAKELRLATAGKVLSPVENFRAQAWLGNIALQKREFSAAEAWLQRAETSLALHKNTHAPARELAFLRALWAKLAMARGSERAQLQREHDLLQSAYDGFLANWAATPILPGGVEFLRYPSRHMLLHELVRLKLILEPGETGIADCLQELQRAQAMGSTARQAGYAPVSLAELRALLIEPGQGLLIFLPGEDQSHWFSLDEKGLGHTWLPSIHVLRKMQLELMQRLSEQPVPGARTQVSPELELAMQSMSNALLPKETLAQLKGWSALTVIGLDTLGYVPLEHLPVGAGQLVDDLLELSYLQSLPMGVLLQQRPDPLSVAPELDLYFHGPPGHLESDESAGNLAAFPNARNESAQPIRLDRAQWNLLSAAFDPARVFQHRGIDATQANLSSYPARHARVAHLLTHGLPSDGLIRTVDLLLAPSADGEDTRLTCQEADELELGALVVISACNAGQGPLRQGEDGGIGFGGAFLQGPRTRAVVLSPAKLDLQAQYQLIPVFYSQLTRGHTPAEALRRARQELRKDPNFKHPSYSLMHVLGLGNQPIFSAGG